MNFILYEFYLGQVISSNSDDHNEQNGVYAKCMLDRERNDHTQVQVLSHIPYSTIKCLLNFLKRSGCLPWTLLLVVARE